MEDCQEYADCIIFIAWRCICILLSEYLEEPSSDDCIYYYVENSRWNSASLCHSLLCALRVSRQIFNPGQSPAWGGGAWTRDYFVSYKRMYRNKICLHFRPAMILPNLRMHIILSACFLWGDQQLLWLAAVISTEASQGRRVSINGLWCTKPLMHHPKIVTYLYSRKSAVWELSSQGIDIDVAWSQFQTPLNVLSGPLRVLESNLASMKPIASTPPIPIPFELFQKSINNVSSLGFASILHSHISLGLIVGRGGGIRWIAQISLVVSCPWLCSMLH